MDIQIKEYQVYQPDEILDLYRSVGWSAYFHRPSTLRRAFAGSLCVLAAYVQGKLAGLIRVVGDGETVVFVQDLLVRPEYQRKGIGTRLMGQIFLRYQHVRQLHLLTDNAPNTVGFYKAVGLTPVEQINGRAFTRARL